MVGSFAQTSVDPDQATLFVITGSLLLSFALMLSQAMESVTRAFYARSDLDLILASPVAAHKLFAVRIVTIALLLAMTVASLEQTVVSTAMPSIIAALKGLDI